MATRALGFTRPAKSAAESCFWTCAAILGMAWSGKFWRTIRRRGNCIISSYCNRRTCSASGFADHRDYHPPLPRSVVEIAENNLLPRADVQPAGGYRVALGRAHQRAAQMRVAVFVAPAGVVRIVRVGWRYLFERALEVCHAARFVLQGGHAQ